MSSESNENYIFTTAVCLQKYKPQNIIPITAQHIQQLSYDGSTFTLGGVELGLVTIVGNIIGVEKSQTCTTYQLDDSTGLATIKFWLVRFVKNILS